MTEQQLGQLGRAGGLWEGDVKPLTRGELLDPKAAPLSQPYRGGGCQAARGSRTLVCGRDHQGVAPVADLVVQLLQGADLPLQDQETAARVEGCGKRARPCWGRCPYTDRGTVDVEGTQDVAFSDGVGDRAVGPLVQVQGLHGDQGGIEGGGALVQRHLVELLLEGGGVVVLVQDGDVHRGGGLRDVGTRW